MRFKHKVNVLRPAVRDVIHQIEPGTVFTTRNVYEFLTCKELHYTACRRAINQILMELIPTQVAATRRTTVWRSVWTQ